MKKAILGKKLGMTQVFDATGLVVPVTVIQAGPCAVIQKKTVDKDGYEAIKVAFEEKRESLLNKPKLGEFKKAGVTPKRHVRELQVDGQDNMEVGYEIKADVFNEGEMVDVSGTTRGRGFTGVIVRWNFGRHNMTHGNGPVHRHVGSIGVSSSFSRVVKGKKMAGHYGHEAVTIQNLQVVKVDAERNVLLIKGAVPGPKGSLLIIKSAVKA
ncbi:MAG: 50S ribosomal protein L3 [Clostridia bacterium]|nr:50S ribosomal protein L3 [Clostridia bacterium]